MPVLVMIRIMVRLCRRHIGQIGLGLIMAKAKVKKRSPHQKGDPKFLESNHVQTHSSVS